MSRTYASLDDAILAVDPSTERTFRCHVHNDHQASASVNVAKGLWYCYACHAGGPVNTALIDVDAKIWRDSILDLLAELDSPHVAESMMDLYTAGEPHPYWLTRFSRDAITQFQLGRDPRTGRPCYPMRDPSGQLLGMVMRNLESQPKYLYPRGVRKSSLLFNYSPEVVEHVVLVEGAMDVIACWEASGITAFGIYGSSLSVEQADLICRCNPRWVHLAFDNDRAGAHATESAIELLSSRGLFVNALDWRRYPTFNDVAELPMAKRRDTLRDLLVV